MLMGLLLPNFFIFNNKKNAHWALPHYLQLSIPKSHSLGPLENHRIKQYYVSCAYVHPSFSQYIESTNLGDQLSSHPHRLVEPEFFYINNLLLIAPRGWLNGS